MKERRPRKRSWFKILARLAAFVVALMAVLAVAGAFGVYLLYAHATQPGAAGEAVEFAVPEGATGSDVARLLASEKLVEHEVLFRIAMRTSDSHEPIKHGHYVLNKGLSARQLLEILRKGPNRPILPSEIPDELRVTIAEGLTIEQIAATMDNPDAFVAAASDPALIARLGVRVATLEGFLMPNTYFFAKKPTEREIVERMIEQFEKEMAALRLEHPNAAAGNLLELVTVASLIEEEARTDEERPLVAAVIYNRLKEGMRLDMDSTLQYALRKYGARLLNDDKAVDSPYNTYKYAALPPGPISNPGVASLRAALSPADADYLYFVSNADGTTHTFSRTLSEHNAAVARYRREIAEQRRQLQTESGGDPR